MTRRQNWSVKKNVPISLKTLLPKRRDPHLYNYLIRVLMDRLFSVGKTAVRTHYTASSKQGPFKFYSPDKQLSTGRTTFSRRLRTKTSSIWKRAFTYRIRRGWAKFVARRVNIWIEWRSRDTAKENHRYTALSKVETTVRSAATMARLDSQWTKRASFCTEVQEYARKGNS